MGHYIPVFFVPIEKVQLPEELPNWHSALRILNEFAGAGRPAVRQSTSRNWWHQYALRILCQAFGIQGLEFLQSEIACICDRELAAAAQALDIVMDKTANGIPFLGASAEENAAIRGLRDDLAQVSLDELAIAISQVRPLRKVDPPVDSGFEAGIGFFAFIKSLRAAIGEAIDEKKCLLYVQPQP